MEQHSGGPVVTIEGLPNGGGLLLGGGDHDKPQAAFGCKSPEITYALAFCHIGDALAGQVVCGAAKIDANQLQDAGLFVFAVRRICQKPFRAKDTAQGLPPWFVFCEGVCRAWHTPKSHIPWEGIVARAERCHWLASLRQADSLPLCPEQNT